jgi:hypothetical protein
MAVMAMMAMMTMAFLHAACHRAGRVVSRRGGAAVGVLRECECAEAQDKNESHDDSELFFHCSILL